MTLKTKMSLLLFLTSISIVSIGFSSWSITAETVAEAKGNIEVDNVIVQNNAASVISSTAFEYFDTGFRDGNTITNTATITYNVSLDLDECKNYLTSSNIELVIELSYKDGITSELDFIYDYLKEVKINNSIITLKNYETNSVEVIKEFNLDDYSENIAILIEYTFSYNEQNTNFYEDIFPYLYNDKISFSMNLTVKEGGI
ncbi:MAG: hypothetical protein IJD46_02835 [Bacilli bacterium]|nr:hypothetical protein [Bacilli bacterium]